MNFEISKDEYKNGAPRRYKLELSLTGAVGLGTVTFLGLVWVFIFGVLVGRGYQPEKAVPELARIMPEAQGKEKKGSEVIKPEDLTFLSTLREEPRHERESQAQAEVKQAAATQPAAAEKPAVAAPPASVAAQAPAKQAEKQAAASKSAASEQQTASSGSSAKPAAVAEVKAPSSAAGEEPVSRPEAPAASAEPGKVAQVEPAASPEEGGDSQEKLEEDIDQTRYDYVYQIASLSEPKAALRFRDKVRKLGFHSEVKVVQGEKKYWHRVVVHFQGRPIDTREMKAKLETLGVDKPLLRSKVPVS